ncbi:MAG: hypothetical protein FE043_03250 [Thermoplasmata archaeon]|nr:MAG: hypothetical protein FE043_03250 [Thermoplasmata archaeon]
MADKTKKEHATTSSEHEWYSQMIQLIKSDIVELGTIPTNVGEVDTGDNGAMYGSLLEKAACISMIEGYRDKISVTKDAIKFRDESSDGDAGEAWISYGKEELSNFVLFMQVKGKVRGMMIDFLMKHKPEGRI